MTTPINTQHSWPSDNAALLIEVCYAQGDYAFVCGVNGSLACDAIESIEKDFADNPDEDFDHGDGSYLFSAKWEPEQRGEFGRVELRGYWCLTFIDYRPWKYINPKRLEATLKYTAGPVAVNPESDGGTGRADFANVTTTPGDRQEG